MVIHFCQTASGRKPVLEHIQSLPVVERLKIIKVLEGLEKAHDLSDRQGLSQVEAALKPIQGKLWEIKFKSKDNRIFYVMKTGALMVLLHAVKKKQWRIDKSDLKVCMKRMREVLE